MENRKHTSEYTENTGEYRTGSTQPPKTHGGIIAVLLILVIFLGGIASILGLMNIHLFRQLNDMEVRGVSSVCFSDEDRQTLPAAQQESRAVLGFTGDEVPYFWQKYRKLPQGIYITCVEEGSSAYHQGIVPGDILLSFDGQRVADMEALNALMQTKVPGDSAMLLLYRDGKQIPFTLTLGES